MSVENIFFVNRTDRQLMITFEGPGEVGVVGSGTVSGGAPLPPNKKVRIPGDALSIEILDRPDIRETHETSVMTDSAPPRRFGKWLEDAD